MNQEKVIDSWVWDEYYERYFWKPIYCTSETSEKKLLSKIFDEVEGKISQTKDDTNYL